MKEGREKKSLFKWLQREGGNIFQEKKIVFLVVILVVAVLLMQIDNLTGRKEGGTEETGEQLVPTGKVDQYGDIEGRLELILSRVKDIGSVSVMLTYKDGAGYKYAETTEKNEKKTTETDRQGGSREITESQESSQLVLARSNQGGEEAILLQEIMPAIRGVIIVAEGARNPKIKEEIIRAVQSVLEIGAHRITVLPGGK